MQETENALVGPQASAVKNESRREMDATAKRVFHRYLSSSLLSDASLRIGACWQDVACHSGNAKEDTSQLQHALWSRQSYDADAEIIQISDDDGEQEAMPAAGESSDLSTGFQNLVRSMRTTLSGRIRHDGAPEDFLGSCCLRTDTTELPDPSCEAPEVIYCSDDETCPALAHSAELQTKLAKVTEDSAVVVDTRAKNSTELQLTRPDDTYPPQDARQRSGTLPKISLPQHEEQEKLARQKVVDEILQDYTGLPPGQPVCNEIDIHQLPTEFLPILPDIRASKSKALTSIANFMRLRGSAARSSLTVAKAGMFVGIKASAVKALNRKGRSQPKPESVNVKCSQEVYTSRVFGGHLVAAMENTHAPKMPNMPTICDPKYRVAISSLHPC